MPLNLFRRDALLGFANQRQSHKPFGEGQVRIVEDRAASRAELLPTGQALVNPCALVLALSFASNFGDATNFATMHTANLAVRPAHGFDIVQAIIVCFELAGYVYQLHGFRFFLR